MERSAAPAANDDDEAPGRLDAKVGYGVPGSWRIGTATLAVRSRSRAANAGLLRRLEAARELGGERFVFPSPVRRASPLGESSLLHILRKADLAARTTVHGFRSSFRSWAGECTDADHAVMELCLAHTVGSAVERAYARSDLMDKRRALLGAWAEAIGAA